MGEGHNPMGPPNTTMTNGNVATMTNGQVASKSGGASATINVTYKGGQQTIQVGSGRRHHQNRCRHAGHGEARREGQRRRQTRCRRGTAQVVFLSLTPLAARNGALRAPATACTVFARCLDRGPPSWSITKLNISNNTGLAQWTHYRNSHV